MQVRSNGYDVSDTNITAAGRSKPLSALGLHVPHHSDVPTAAADRIGLIDGLRGFALAGVLLANLTTFTLYYFLPDGAALSLPSANVNRLLEPLYGIVVSNKFLTMFSLLFGVGFSLHLQRTAGDRAGMRRYFRRLCVLLAIGLLHAVFWWGDILREYALIGLLLILLRRVSVRSLAITGLVLGLVVHPLVLAFLPWPLPIASHDDAFAAALAAFSSHDWSTAVHGNIVFDHWWLRSRSGLVFWIAACLMLGAAAGRHGLLDAPARHSVFWRRALTWALPAGLAMSAFATFVDYGHVAMLAEWMPTLPGRFAGKFMHDAATLLLAVGYMALFRALFDARGALRGLAWAPHTLVPVGRMALTNYLMHSLLGIVVFYGAGLGIGARHGYPGVIIAWALLFGFQIVFSRWWLERYRFGPCEWAWRSLTYGRAQPMRVVGKLRNDRIDASLG